MELKNKIEAWCTLQLQQNLYRRIKQTTMQTKLTTSETAATPSPLLRTNIIAHIMSSPTAALPTLTYSTFMCNINYLSLIIGSVVFLLLLVSVALLFGRKCYKSRKSNASGNDVDQHYLRNASGISYIPALETLLLQTANEANKAKISSSEFSSIKEQKSLASELDNAYLGQSEHLNRLRCSEEITKEVCNDVASSSGVPLLALDRLKPDNSQRQGFSCSVNQPKHEFSENEDDAFATEDLYSKVIKPKRNTSRCYSTHNLILFLCFSLIGKDGPEN